MPKPKVFISHSAKEPNAQAVLSALIEALESAGYPLRVDREHLDLGDPWRATLNMWLGGCNAAIVLLSEKALESDFVAYETSVLSYRWKTTAPTFSLIPVFLGEVSYDRLKQSRLEPQDLHEVQAIVGEADTDRIVERVLEKLAEVEEGLTPIELQAEHLVALLGKVDDYLLRNEAPRLGVDLGPWDPVDNLRLSIALKMLSLGLDQPVVVDAIDSFRQSIDDRKNLGDMIDLVASSWVDLRCAKLIAEVTRRAPTQRAVSVTATQQLIARMYVVRASERRPSVAWRIPESIAVIDPRKPAESLVESVRKSLMHELGVADAANLIADIRAHEKLQRPIFVAVRADGVDGDLLRRLREEFQGVTFFFLVAEDAACVNALPEDSVEALRPDLDPAYATDFCDIYDAYIRVMCPR